MIVWSTLMFMEPMNPAIPNMSVTVYAEDQPEYISLPCYRELNGTITIRWKLTWKERIILLLKGELYHQVMTFNQPLQPIKLTVDCPIILDRIV